MIQVNKVVRNTYNTTYRDNVLDLEVRIETNPTNIQVSTPNDTQYITPEQVQAQYLYFKDLNSLVQSINQGKTPRINKSVKNLVTESV